MKLSVIIALQQRFTRPVIMSVRWESARFQNNVTQRREPPVITHSLCLSSELSFEKLLRFCTWRFQTRNQSCVLESPGLQAGSSRISNETE